MNMQSNLVPPSLFLFHCLQGAVPKGNATKEYMESLQLKPGEVIYKCPKCCSIKPERAHHCRYGLLLSVFKEFFALESTASLLACFKHL